MLKKLIDLCLTHRPVVLLLTLISIAFGLVSLRDLPFDAFPETAPPLVNVNTLAEGLSAEEVELQVTRRVEQSISGMPGLVHVRSLSNFGFSQVTAVFEEDADLLTSRQLVAERLASVTLPEGVARPSLGPMSSGLGEIFQYILVSPGRSLAELRVLHDYQIRPRLLSVPGVAEVNTWGGHEPQIEIVVDPHKLRARGRTLGQIEDALRDNHLSVGGGLITESSESMTVHGRGRLTSLKALAELPVAGEGVAMLRLGDVAEIRRGHALRRGALTAFGNGEHVMGLVFALPGQNTRAIAQHLEARLSQIQTDLPEDVELRVVYNRTDLIDQILETVRNNLFEGALLVIAILFVLMGNLRAGLIVALAIPLSMLFAFNLMLKFGVAGSLMSLGAIDFGLLVDSSVIMVENAERRLAEAPTDADPLEVVRDAAAEVRRPTLFGELIITSVYLPILALEGVEGALFRPMALTMIFALLGSMLLSLTLTPVLASYLLTRRQRPEPWAARQLKRLYTPVLDRALSHRWPVVAIGLGCLIAAGALSTTLGARFIPRLEERAITANTVRLAGVSLNETLRYGTRLETHLKSEFPNEIKHIWTRTGTGEVATDPMGLEVSDIFIMLHPRSRWTRVSTQEELTDELRTFFENVPGLRTTLSQPIELRINELSSGLRSELGIRLFGDDLEVLRDKGQELMAVLAGVKGIASLSTEQLLGQHVVEINVDHERAIRAGLSAREVLRAVELIGGRPLGEYYEGEVRLPLVLRVNEPLRQQPELLEELPLTGPQGPVMLGEVARVSVRPAPASLNREWGQRRLLIQAELQTDDVLSVVHAARKAVDEHFDAPPGYHVTFSGQFENYERARSRLFVLIPLTLLLVLTLLYLTYGRFSDMLRVFSGVPFAAVGGVVALWGRDLPFSISAAVGFVALMGIAVLGDIVLVSTIRGLTARGIPTLDAVRQAALMRVRPVLMTGLVAALGFLPMAMSTGVGAEVQRPLATVVIGGVLTSTLSTLVVLPVLYVIFTQTRRS
ncbi:CusA/CzcA family heavy metal efflux RND transporter [Lujinxingia litoralis]|uniref:CusA/CzcA family heavy metal efflux RND transporter n=1 Tax=Lujinxingia litoralis TaxID=2211119 RepID=A0A328C6W4_9DELT|nr:CusA/CzcA family heavy metal efflux RND transporter [Lujinxingia litoralis]RAL21217.1 CusA/CzcA family heavy metal efflux RND transporter [Lujinxingia litoralis]